MCLAASEFSSLFFPWPVTLMTKFNDFLLKVHCCVCILVAYIVHVNLWNCSRLQKRKKKGGNRWSLGKIIHFYIIFGVFFFFFLKYMILLSDFGECGRWYIWYYNQQLWREKWQVEASPADWEMLHSSIQLNKCFWTVAILIEI